jgi:hypothetical protein
MFATSSGLRLSNGVAELGRIDFVLADPGLLPATDAELEYGEPASSSRSARRNHTSVGIHALMLPEIRDRETGCNVGLARRS